MNGVEVTEVERLSRQPRWAVRVVSSRAWVVVGVVLAAGRCSSGGDGAAFFRVQAPEPTEIVAFRPDGVLIWSGASAAGTCEVQRAGAMGVGGTWGGHARIVPAGTVSALRVTAQPMPGGMAFIPGGIFDMGSEDAESSVNERPVHAVHVSPFFMDVHEVRKSLWDEVWLWAVSNGYSFSHAGDGKGPEHPVHSLDWYDCVKWCNARSEREGLVPCYGVAGSVYREGQANPECAWTSGGYRLPTEAEWEKAARGGLRRQRFPWGDADTIQHARANYLSSDTNAFDTSETRGYHPQYEDGTMPFTSPVGSFPSNPYGLHDMAGNVIEYCWDWFVSTYYAGSPADDPVGPEGGTDRVIRGGSWQHDAKIQRCSLRTKVPPAAIGNRRGFRCARGLPPAGMALVRSGEFQMGDAEGGYGYSCVHTVVVSQFHMDRTEVTKRRWDEVYSWAVTNGYSFDNAGSGKAATHPVHTVNWFDCVKWCNARTEHENATAGSLLAPCYTVSGQVFRAGQADPDCRWASSGYRLPTEAEWEKAARGGKDGHRFPWHDSETIQHSRANYLSTDSESYDTSQTRGHHPEWATGGEPYTSPAGSFAANGHGLHDMAGNVWEWCWDSFDSGYYEVSPTVDPRGPARFPGWAPTQRGGCWTAPASNARCACRFFTVPYDAGQGTGAFGFRCVRKP
jgi:formylglycine-generating enzyme required for sulfatase activity